MLHTYTVYPHWCTQSRVWIHFEPGYFATGERLGEAKEAMAIPKVLQNPFKNGNSYAFLILASENFNISHTAPKANFFVPPTAVCSFKEKRLLINNNNNKALYYSI